MVRRTLRDPRDWLPALAGAAVFAIVNPACGQSSAPTVEGSVPTVEAALSDWGLADVRNIRLGRVAVVEDSAAYRLTVYWLRDDEAVPEAHPDRSAVPAFSGNSLVVAELDGGNRNRLGGFFSGFERAPSRTDVSISTAPDGRRALRVACNVAETGYCGMWLHFFDLESRPVDRRYLDARGFSTLSFWVRGEHGGERFEVSLADANWERREDARPLGELGDFVGSGRVDAAWQRVDIPLDRLPEDVNPGALASLVLRAPDRGQSRVYLRRIALSVDPGALPSLPEAGSGSLDRAVHADATWIWNTAEILGDAALRERLLEFLEERGLKSVFLQLPNDSAHTGAQGEILIDGDRIRPLVANLTELGVRAYALDGHPAHGLRENHARVLATVDNVVEYNRHSAPGERFHGIRHDIEPYLLPGFHGPGRDTLVAQYLDLVAEVGRRARTAGLVYGVDMPFWYDTPAELTYETVSVMRAGEVKPVSHHLIDLADEVAVMDYRTVAFGADGTIRHARGELEYAESRGVPVLIALETHPLPDEMLLTFGGKPIVDLDRPVPGHGVAAAWRLALDSIRIAVVRQPAADAGTSSLRSALEDAGVDPEQAVVWPLTGVVAVPGAKLSFATLPGERLERVMRETRDELSAYESFAGFAIHHVWSYADLLDGGN